MLTSNVFNEHSYALIEGADYTMPVGPGLEFPDVLVLLRLKSKCAWLRSGANERSARRDYRRAKKTVRDGSMAFSAEPHRARDGNRVAPKKVQFR